MSNTDRDSMLERWADGMEKLEQYYEGIYGPPATPPSLPPITTYDAMLEAIANGMERAKRNINKKSPTYHSDSVAYTKTVPAGNVPYASLEQIGGKTLVWNQLFQPSLIGASYSKNGINCAAVTGSCAFTVTGTYVKPDAGDKNLYFFNSSYIPTLISGHKYILTNTSSKLCIYAFTLPVTGNVLNVDNQKGIIITANATGKPNLCMNVGDNIEDGTVFNETVYLNCIDLTLLYGAGNEPSTVSEFTAQFPASYYSYNAGQLLSAGVTSVVSDINLMRGVTIEQGVIGTNNGIPSASSTRVRTASFIKVKPSTTYEFSVDTTNNPNVRVFCVYQYSTNDFSGYKGSVDQLSAETATLTTDATTQYIKVTWNKSNNADIIPAEVVNPVITYETHPIATYPIPAEIQALEGYGWSAGTVSNYIDYERKVFVKCVDKIVLDGTQTLTANWRADSTGVGWYYQYNLTQHALPPTNFTLGNIVSDRLMSQTYGDLYTHNVGIALNPSADYGIFIWQSDTSLTTVSAINTYMSNNPITVYYELATPIETDISAYLTDDNLIEVEAGGTLTFPNSNGTDYQIPVPSSETYVVGEP